MDSFERDRRSLLFVLSGLVLDPMMPPGTANGQGAAKQGNVLGSSEGEHLVHFRDHGNIFIKISSLTGAGDFAMGTQQVMAGSGIPIHRHFKMNETFYVLEGSGIFVLDEQRYSIKKGGTIFVPKSSWHGFENPDQELLLLWVVSPPGLDGFFRDTCSPPGVPAKQLTREQIKEIALKKYETEFR